MIPCMAQAGPKPQAQMLDLPALKIAIIALKWMFKIALFIQIFNRLLAKFILQERKAPKVRGHSAEENPMLT